MSTAETNVLNFLVVCISEFAVKYQMQMREAYLYLRKHQGLAFLQEYYDVEHTLSFDEIMDDLYQICSQNGGTIL